MKPQEQLFSNTVRYRNGKVEYRDNDDVVHPAFLITSSTMFKGYIEDGIEAIRIRKNLKWDSAGQLGFCEVVVLDEATGKKPPFHALSSQTIQRLNGICNFIGFALPI